MCLKWQKKRGKVIKFSTCNYLDKMCEWWLEVESDGNCCSLSWYDGVFQKKDQKWGGVKWEWAMACASSPLKHSWAAWRVQRPPENWAVGGFFPVWRVFTFSQLGCPTFRRQVLLSFALVVNGRHIGGTKTRLALDAAELVPKLDKNRCVVSQSVTLTFP